jgi:hypothetical protein
LRPADDVVDELIERFSELEDYWSKGSVGRHIQLLPVEGQGAQGGLAKRNPPSYVRCMADYAFG